MAVIKSIISCVICFLFMFFVKSSNTAHSVISYGAKPDGRTDSTRSFLRAWTLACNSVKASSIYVPKGRYLIKTAVFRGPCKNKITLQIDGTTVSPTGYRALGNSGNWILFVEVNRLTVIGGTLDAKGTGLWACRRSGKNCPVDS